MLRAEDASWSVSVCRDLGAISSAGTEGCKHDLMAVVHVGFDRPASFQFESLFEQYKGRVLLTAAAKHALPHSYTSSVHPVSEVEGHKIYLALSGWGYSIADEVHAEPERSIRRPEGWVRHFLSENTDAETEFSAAKIVDDLTYLKCERLLSRELRAKSGFFRYRNMFRVGSDELAELVRCAPPWLLERSLDTIELTVRVANILRNLELTTVSDLGAYSTDELLRLQNFGRKSVRDLFESLLGALNEGPYDPSDLFASPENSFVDELDKELAGLEQRLQDILSRRMGFRKPSETLHEIGEDYSITRERIRQLESKAMTAILKSSALGEKLASKVEALLLGRDFPLPVLGLEAIDSWFKGVGKAIEPVAYLLSWIDEPKFSLVQIGGVDYIGRISAEDWLHLSREAKKMLRTGSEESWSESHCEMAVKNLLRENQSEFRGMFWQQVTSHCHFVTSEDGTRKLASMGRGADQIVEVVLSESDRPLHYREIAKRVRTQWNKDIDVRRAHSAAATVGILFGRGTFGLQRHLNVDEVEQASIREELENIILEGPDERQWHSNELLGLIAERGLSDSDFIDKYIVDHILRASPALRSLGRMAWCKAGNKTARIDVQQAVVSLLQKAGTPLTSEEIRQRLIALRGVSENFQIIASSSVIRLGPGYFGLNDRDIGIKRAKQPQLLDGLFEVLNKRGSGIHISEVPSELNEIAQITPTALFSIASMDPRFQLNTAEYLFLTEWESSRREALLDAVTRILTEANEPLSFDAIVQQAEFRTKRVYDRRAVSGCLKAIEATFDGDFWHLGNVAELDEEDLPIEAEEESSEAAQ
ncbi:MAG: hypothetical protein KIT15_05150 [Xanthobacteraceae bacterium]|nr:hypothetical protein [Xanthobacteraceae bacterium]